MVLVAYRQQVDLRTATLHVRRVKQGTPSTHPILGDELRAMRRLQREQDPSLRSCSRRNAVRHSLQPGSPACSSRLAQLAKLPFKAHPHMLRHACGFALTNRGHDTRALQAYLGHRNIQHTLRYTNGSHLPPVCTCRAAAAN
jgi:integrase